MNYNIHTQDDAELDRITEKLNGNVPNAPWEFRRESLRRMFLGRYRCDLEAYKVLKACSAAKNMEQWNQWRAENRDREIYLQGIDLGEGYYQQANFSNIHFEGTNFHWAHCEGTSFVQARCDEAYFAWARCEEASFAQAHCKGTSFFYAGCEGATFLDAHCENAWFVQANCERANFQQANCEGANFNHAHCAGTFFYNADFDGKSIFTYCRIDDDTDFCLTNLGAIRIEPGKRAMLERNIRRLNWETWYERTAIAWPWAVSGYERSLRCFCYFLRKRFWRKVAYNIVCFLLLFLKVVLSRLKVNSVRLFWFISDYGYSTGRIIRTFFLCIISFALLYTLCPSMLSIGGNAFSDHSNFVDFISHFLSMLCFAAATMMTLGFGNINVAVEGNTPNLPGMLMVMLNLVVGYSLLAVLVTRLSILFQTMSPGYVVRKKAHQKRNHTVK